MEPSSISPMETATAEAPIREPKKNSKAPIIIASVASVLAVAGIAFGVFGLIQANSKDQQTSNVNSQAEANNESSGTDQGGTKDSIENISKIALPEVRSLLEKYMAFDYITYGKNLFTDGLTEDYKYILALKNLDYKNRVSAKSEESSLDEYDFTYDELNSSYQDLFGSSSNVEKKTSGGCFVPYLSEEYNKYVSTYACGGVDPSIYIYEVLDYSAENEILTIDIAYGHLFQDSSKAGELTIDLNSGTETVIVQSTNAVSQYLDKLPQYKLTFTSEADKYILTSVEKIN